jgi:hypothetical protein
MTDRIERNLPLLPEPAAPAELSAAVMARVSHLADEPAPAPRFVSDVTGDSSRERGRRGSHRPAWAAAVAGLSIVSIAWTYGRLAAGQWPGLVSSPLGPRGFVSLPADLSTALGLALGLLLYVGGLFAPVSGTEKP